jgi:hypothetical protein
VPSFLRHARLRNLLTAPLIYSVGLPLLLLDIWVTAYQWICFPIYGIARVPRRACFIVDRHRLGYLNVIEKAHCMYCSYVTGVIAYVGEVTARTEQYWCPIKHARPALQPHAHYDAFVDYGDAAGYRRRLASIRRQLHGSRGTGHARRPGTRAAVSARKKKV